MNGMGWFCGLVKINSAILKGMHCLHFELPPVTIDTGSHYRSIGAPKMETHIRADSGQTIGVGSKLCWGVDRELAS